MKDLILVSLQAHREYVLSRIENAEGKVYYEEMMDNIKRFVQSLDNYYLPVFVLELAFSQLRNQRFSLNRELKYKKLALAHANEIITCINRRFYVKN